MAILLVVIDGYSIGGYLWILMLIILMAIGGYFVKNICGY
jgi:ABC-type microcin C transport system permease subunit YejB